MIDWTWQIGAANMYTMWCSAHSQTHSDSTKLLKRGCEGFWTEWGTSHLRTLLLCAQMSQKHGRSSKETTEWQCPHRIHWHKKSSQLRHYADTKFGHEWRKGGGTSTGRVLNLGKNKTDIFLHSFCFVNIHLLETTTVFISYRFELFLRELLSMVQIFVVFIQGVIERAWTVDKFRI